MEKMIGPKNVNLSYENIDIGMSSASFSANEQCEV
jgi:hypothetical protein